MALVVPNTGEVIALNYVTGKVGTTETLKYKLFATNVTPAETDTAASYTEAVGGGYADKTIAGASWTVTGGAPSDATASVQTWTFTGPLTTNPNVYGYFAVRSSTGDLFLAEAFSPFTPTASGDNIALTPKITAD